MKSALEIPLAIAAEKRTTAGFFLCISLGASLPSIAWQLSRTYIAPNGSAIRNIAEPMYGFRYTFMGCENVRAQSKKKSGIYPQIFGQLLDLLRGALDAFYWTGLYFLNVGSAVRIN